MKIVKDKKAFNSFSIQGLTLGKILVIQQALQEQDERGTTTMLRKELLKQFQEQTPTLELN